MFRNVFFDIAFLCLPFAIIDSISQENNQSIKIKKVGNACFLIICAIVLFYSIFRDPLTGTDSLNNYKAFNLILSNSNFTAYEVGYVKFVRLVQYFSNEFTVFIKWCSLVILLPIYYVVNKFPYRSFILLLFVLGELNATFDVLKGFIAFSFIIVGFYLWNIEDKKIGIVFLLLSMLFHLTSVFFVAVFCVAKIIKRRRPYIKLLFAGIIIFSIPLMSTILNWAITRAGFFYARYYAYLDLLSNTKVDFSLTYVVIYLATSIIALLYFPNLLPRKSKYEETEGEQLNKNESIGCLVDLNWMMFMTAILSSWLPVTHRYLKLGMIFNYILVGCCLDRERNLYKRIIIMGIVLAMNFMFAYVNNNGFIYSFAF